MRVFLMLKTLWPLLRFSTAILGAVLLLIALAPAKVLTKEPPIELVTICHKPGTPAERTLWLARVASEHHLKHGDTIGECGAAADECPCFTADDVQASIDAIDSESTNIYCTEEKTFEDLIFTEIIATDKESGYPIFYYQSGWEELSNLLMRFFCATGGGLMRSEMDIAPSEDAACRDILVNVGGSCFDTVQ